MITALQAELPAETIEAFITPAFTREELEDGRRIAVRFGDRVLDIDEMDADSVQIEVGVIGLMPPKASGSTYRVQEVAACDALDGLLDDVLALWQKSDDGEGALRRQAMAFYRFVQLEQTLNYNPEKLYSDGVWLSMIQLTYQDTRD